MERFASIWLAIRTMPWERWFLVALAALRAELTLTPAFWPIPGWAKVLSAIGMAIVSADWIEHGLLYVVFGKSYIPGLRAGGEWEGGNVALDPAEIPTWKKMYFMFTFPWETGDDTRVAPLRRRWMAGIAIAAVLLGLLLMTVMVAP